MNHPQHEPQDEYRQQYGQPRHPQHGRPAQHGYPQHSQPQRTTIAALFAPAVRERMREARERDGRS